ncbi:MAG: hypothetical protein Kow0080_21300 [Candidatus Promineifilaceae bacterium]
MRKYVLVFLLVLALALVACGGDSDDAASSDAGSTSVGDAARGEELFNQVTIGPNSAPGCVTCHSLEPGVVLVGPSQSDVATRAETRVDGMSAEDYIRQSIIEPNAYVVDGFTEGVMYQNYGEELSARDINDIVAFMLTLK